MRTKYHRKSIRLKEYDYSQEGAYFITICIKDKSYMFGSIVEEQIRLSRVGKIVQECWLEIPKHYKKVELDEYVIMPNHLHGIIFILDNVGVQYIEPLLQNKYQKIIPQSIGSIIRTYKSAVTRAVNKSSNYLFFRWQRNYYEHIIRHEEELNKIREYIVNNPLQWELDIENPNRKKDYKSFTSYLKEQVIKAK